MFFLILHLHHSYLAIGATASVKANAMMSSFNTGKYALRALSSSLAKEFGPQGVHVGHAIIDGVIDIPRTKEWLKDAGPDAKISPDGVSLSQLFILPANLSRLPNHIGTCIVNPDLLLPGKLICDLMSKNGRVEAIEMAD
jgi:hypothetical protein